MIQLTGKQCKTARLLLKWNLRELAFRSGVKARAIDLFEHGTKQLFATEKEALGKIFRKEGVAFLDFGEVRLEDGKGGNMPMNGGFDAANQVAYSLEEAELSQLYEERAERRYPSAEGEDAAAG